ncbi:MAG TPA: hypothetical protein VIC29_05370 [Steroidobacteraceae bacterium]
MRGVRIGARPLLLALALTAPALCLGQEAGSTGEGTSTPAANTPAAINAPGGAAPVAVLPGTSMPGEAVPFGGLTGLRSLPAEYTNYDVSAGLGETDNVNLSDTHRKAQTLSAVSAAFDFIRSGSHLDLNAVGNFSDTDYLQGAYSNQVLGRFDGLADLTLWERHFKWLVRDDYGDQQTEVLQSLTPVNLQRVNVFSTGPDLTLQPTLSTFVEMQGLYSRNTWQNEPFSGNTESGSLTAGHQVSPAASLSLVGEVEQQRFDNRNLNTNYQVREYYGHYLLRGARTRVDLQGGVAQANDTGSWRSSPLLRASLSRTISPFSTLSIAAGREYSNAMGSFASLANGVTGGIPVGSATQTTGNALRTYGNVTWGYHRLRTSIDLLGNWERESYDVQSKFDFTQSDIGVNLRRQLTPRLSANILATLNRGQYGNQGFTNTYGTGGAGLVYHPGTWVVIYGRYDHQFRRSSGLPAQGLGYDENRIFIMIGYYPHSSGTGLPREMGGNGFR